MNQKLKKIMILSGTYIVLMTVLLIGVSTAKYTESTVAYSSFGTAGFNVVLLGTDANGQSSSAQFGKTLLASDLTPGMKYTGITETNTAKVLPFQVANGTSSTDVSQVALDYSITLRTTRNLPLDFQLLHGTTIYESSEPVALDKNGDPVAEGGPGLDENGIAWYEWTFQSLANTEEGTEAVDTNPVFSLTAGTVTSNNHSLVVEWPVTIDEDGVASGNTTDYMKEIELLEVRIKATQKNNTTESPADIDVLTSEEYSKGFIVLDPEKETQVYEVDYRALKPGSIAAAESGWTYDFVIDNGVSLGEQPTKDAEQYKVSILAPVMWGGEEVFGTADYRYYLWKEERTEDKPFGTGIQIPYYRMDETYYKVNLETGDRENYTDWFTTSGRDEPEFRQMVLDANKADSEYTFVKEQRFSDSADPEAYPVEMKAQPDGAEAVFTLENRVTEDETPVLVSRGDTFHLEVYDDTGRQSFPAYLQLNGRLKIVIEKATESAESSEDGEYTEPEETPEYEE